MSIAFPASPRNPASAQRIAYGDICGQPVCPLMVMSWAIYSYITISQRLKMGLVVSMKLYNCLVVIHVFSADTDFYRKYFQC